MAARTVGDRNHSRENCFQISATSIDFEQMFGSRSSFTGVVCPVSVTITFKHWRIFEYLMSVLELCRFEIQMVDLKSEVQADLPEKADCWKSSYRSRSLSVVNSRPLKKALDGQPCLALGLIVIFVGFQFENPSRR